MKNIYAYIALLAISLPSSAQQPNEGQASPESAPSMQQMQGHMQGMRGLMERIHNTTDPQERQRLMHEHMQSMQQGMTMMKQMGPQRPPAECRQGDTPCQMQRMEEQQQMMHQRMNMMQMMMEQMMGQMAERNAEEAPAER